MNPDTDGRTPSGAAVGTKTVVLDDDPTGTQSAQDVDVVLSPSTEAISDVLRERGAVFIQTNTRALHEEQAVSLLRHIRRQAMDAAALLGTSVDFVLRGDSTLRGHVFSEIEVFAKPNSRVLFVPAFPDGGRTTADGIHRVRIDGEDVPAHLTEFAADPVFPFTTSHLVTYIEQRSKRPPWPVPLRTVRRGAHAIHREIVCAPDGAVVVPDAITNVDVATIAEAARIAWRGNLPLVVRGAAPLAAHIARAHSHGLLALPIVPSPGNTLIVCGSHTKAASAQIAAVAAEFGEPIALDTTLALADPQAAAVRIAPTLEDKIARQRFAVLMTSRLRAPEHNTLDHGARLMRALTDAVRLVRDSVTVVIAKGGITSAEVARVGLGADTARVAGQVLPGIPVWQVPLESGRQICYVIVPGNVGGPETLVQVLAAVGCSSKRSAEGQ